jgi:GT2 family glycosyltransferase
MNPSQPVSVSAPVRASVFVVAYESADRLSACLQSILDQSVSGGSVETIVVDNASSDGSADLVRREFPEATLIANEDNRGFAAANNQAWAVSRGDYLFLVNPDSILEPNALQGAIDYLEAHRECGLVGGLLLDDDGARAPSARRFPTLVRKMLTQSGIADRFPKSKILGGADYRWHDHHKPLDVDWVPGAFTAIRRDLVEQIGFFDERYYLYYEETDLCRRAKQYGWAVRFIPDAVVHHSGGASSRKVKQYTFDEAGSQVRPFRLRAECLYHRKNGGLLAVLGNVGFEWTWHQLRRAVNFRPGRMAAAKRRYSRLLVRDIEDAVKATSLGLVCPPKPW